MGLPRRRHPHGREVRGTEVPTGGEAMSYTLRGRLESRLAVTLIPFLVAAALGAVMRDWWPVELAALMVGVGVALDALLYHRVLPYQPGWVAVPAGLLEL